MVPFPGHFGLLMSLTQQTKKGAIVLAVVVDPDHQGESGRLVHMEVRENGWSTWRGGRTCPGIQEVLSGVSWYHSAVLMKVCGELNPIQEGY